MMLITGGINHHCWFMTYLLSTKYHPFPYYYMRGWRVSWITSSKWQWCSIDRRTVERIDSSDKFYLIPTPSFHYWQVGNIFSQFSLFCHCCCVWLLCTSICYCLVKIFSFGGRPGHPHVVVMTDIEQIYNHPRLSVCQHMAVRSCWFQVYYVSLASVFVCVFTNDFFTEDLFTLNALIFMESRLKLSFNNVVKGR